MTDPRSGVSGDKMNSKLVGCDFNLRKVLRAFAGFRMPTFQLMTFCNILIQERLFLFSSG